MLPISFETAMIVPVAQGALSMVVMRIAAYYRDKEAAEFVMREMEAFRRKNQTDAWNCFDATPVKLVENPNDEPRAVAMRCID